MVGQHLRPVLPGLGFQHPNKTGGENFPTPLQLAMSDGSKYDSKSISDFNTIGYSV